MLCSGEPRTPIADLRLSFNEVGDFPEMGTGEGKEKKKKQEFFVRIPKALKGYFFCFKSDLFYLSKHSKLATQLKKPS